MKFRERTKIVTFPVFLDYKVQIIVSTDVNESCKKRGHDDLGQAAHIFSKNRNESWLVFPKNAPVGHIAHECWHCVRRIMMWAGAELDNESVAYHLGYLTQIAYDFMKKS